MARHTALGGAATTVDVALPDVAPGTNSDAVRIDPSVRSAVARPP